MLLGNGIEFDCLMLDDLSHDAKLVVSNALNPKYGNVL
jgi:hypothetical protein